MWGLHLLSPREALELVRAAIRARLGLVVAFGVTALVATLALNAAAPYTVRMVIAFAPLNESRTLSELGVPAPPAPTAAELTSTVLLQRMIDERLVARPETVGRLQGKLSVQSYSGGQATLIATDETEADATNLVAGWSAAIQRSRGDELDARFNAAEAALRDQLRSLERRGVSAAGSADQRDLRRQISRLREAGKAVPAEVRVVDGPTTVASRGIRNELAILLAALVLGCLVALALELRNGRIRTPASARVSFGVPVLGRLTSGGEDGARRLAVRLEAAAAAKNGAGPPGTVLMTPSETVERPYESALALARALAEDGTATTLVVWRDHGSAAALGLSGEHELEDRSLRIVRDDRPARELAPRLAELRWHADRLVILGPALTREPGGLLVAKAADLWLVVAALGRTRDREARRLVEELDGFDRPPDGVVLISESVPARARQQA